MKNSRKSYRKNKKFLGGAMPNVNPADINDKTMLSPSSQNLSQGVEYNKIHMGQHGGAFTPMSGAPVGDQGLLDSNLRSTARIGPIDESISAIQGMSDQSGGRSKKSRKANKSRAKKSRANKSRAKKSKRVKKSKKASRKNKKNSRKSKNSKRKQRGGMNNFRPASASAPGSLLPASMEDRAVSGMNPEWKLAGDPQAFAPKMV